jgi:hypothetical protein
MRSARPAEAAVLVLAVLSCDSGSAGLAHGDTHSLIVVAADSLWAAVAPEVLSALEPRIFTVRNEKTFDITRVSPADSAWLDLRRFKQVLPIGSAQDFWVAPVLEGAAAAPGIVEETDVWARGQRVTAVVLPEENSVAALRQRLPQLAQLLDRRFREYAAARMFASRADTALRDTLERVLGFSLLVPRVYSRQDLGTTQVFRNHAEMGGVLMRTIVVTWRPGVLRSPTAQHALTWRDSVGRFAWDLLQNVDTERIETRTLPGVLEGIEVQGVWRGSDPSWPSAGPFMGRIVPCPDQNRTYLLDAWLFAPGKAKYEYMIQLETILDSFGCGREDGRRIAAHERA